MRRRALLAAAATGVAGLGGCLTSIGSPDDSTPTEPPYETLAEPFYIEIENLDDEPHTLTVTVEIDEQPFGRMFSLEPSEHVEDWCFDRAGRYLVVAENATGERDFGDFGEMEPGLTVRIGVSRTGSVGISQPVHVN